MTVTAAPTTVGVGVDRAGATRARVVPVWVVVLGASVAIGLAAAADPFLGVAAALVVAVALVVVVEPDLATLLLLGLLYANVVGVAVRFHGVPAAAAAVLPLGFLVPFTHTLLHRRAELRVPRALPFLLGFLVVNLASAATTDGDRTVAAFEAFSYAAEGLVLFFLVVNVVRTPAMLRRATWVVVAVAGLLSALTLVQAATGTYERTYLGFAQYGLTTGPAVLAAEHEVHAEVATDGSDRQSGPVGEPNRYAQVLLVVVPPALVLASVDRRRRARAVAAVAAMAAVVATALTLSRGAAIALALTFVVALFMRTIRFGHVVLVGAAVIVLSITTPAFTERLATLGAIGGEQGLQGADGSVQSRYTEVNAALLALDDHPLLGVGPGLFPAAYPAYAQEAGGRPRPEPRQAHNLILGIAADTGLLGLGCVAGAVGVTLRSLLQARRRLARTHPDLAALATGYFLALLGYLAAGMFLHLSYARYFWLLLALASAAGTLVPPEARDRHQRRALRLEGRSPC